MPTTRRARLAVGLSLLALLLTSATHPALAATPVIPGFPIDTIVVLMLENRAFDHLLGWHAKANPEINGLTGDEFNLLNATEPTSKRVVVSPDAAYVDPNPSHSVRSTTEQLFGVPHPEAPLPDPAPMNGFVQNGEREIGAGLGHTVMMGFAPEAVPIISTLVEQFCVVDGWHSSVPGPTEVNRLYAHSGTSHGSSDNDNGPLLQGYPQQSFYAKMQAENVSWAIYYQQISTALALKDVRSAPLVQNIVPWQAFLDAAGNGTLPNYSFLEPRYFPMFGQAATDQHPSHSVAEGEALIKEVYEAVRASPQWNRTLLVITYDEHGGFYDHVPTPQRNVPNPDGINAVPPDDPFAFDRLGVRVPAVLVSPWIAAGRVEHEAVGPTPDSHYEHSSLPATTKKIFGWDGFLTKRDAWAGTFEHLLMDLDEPRTDCPMTLPPAPQSPADYIRYEESKPITELQASMIELAAALHGVPASDDLLAAVPTQRVAGEWVLAEFERFLAAAKAGQV